MNRTQHPRQPYYNQAALPHSGRPYGGPHSRGPQPLTSTHFYQHNPGSRRALSPQRLPFNNSRQGPANFIPKQSYYNQARLPPFNRPYDLPPRHGPQPPTFTHFYQQGPGSRRVMNPQRLPFNSSRQGPRDPIGAGTLGFNPGTGPVKYARANYPAQPPFTPSVQATPVMNRASQQQRAQPCRPRRYHTKQKPKLEQVVVPPKPEHAPMPDSQHPAASPPAPEEADPTREDKEEVLVPTEPEPTPALEPQCPAVCPPVSEETQPTMEDKEEVVVPAEPEPTPVLRSQCLGQYPAAEETEPTREDKEEVVVPAEPEPTPVLRPQCLGLSPPAPVETEPTREDKEEVVVPTEPEPTPALELQCPAVCHSLPKETQPTMEDKEELPFLAMSTAKDDLWRSQEVQEKKPIKLITGVSFSNDIELNKAEKAWKPSRVRAVTHNQVAVVDQENLKTQCLFRKVHSILNKLTPEKFPKLAKQMTELTIDTEERLRGVTDIIFEKAISESHFSVIYANMCHWLIELKVQAKDNLGANVTFRRLLLKKCQKEYEKDNDANELIEKKQKELEAASGEEEKQLLHMELREAKDKAHRRSLGNIKFIGELFNVKMLTEVIMHNCALELLQKHDDESLECLCNLLSTIGKDLDSEKAKPRMDQYFQQMEKIIKKKKNSSRIRFMVQDVVELRQNNWIPKRSNKGPKTISQVHKEAKLEDHMEHMKVLQASVSKRGYHQ